MMGSIYHYTIYLHLLRLPVVEADHGDPVTCSRKQASKDALLDFGPSHHADIETA